MAEMKLHGHLGDRSNAERACTSAKGNLSPRDYESTATTWKPFCADHENLFIVDTEGSHEPISTGLSAPRMRRSLSPTASDSSEEVIVFAGRIRTPMVHGDKRIPSPHNSNSPTRTNRKKTESSAMDVLLQACEAEDTVYSKSTLSASHTATSEPQPNLPTREPSAAISEIQIASAVNGAQPKANSHPRRRRKRGVASTKRQLEEELLADYIANIDDSDDLRSLSTKPGVKGVIDDNVDIDEWQDETGESATERQIDGMLDGAIDWNATDLQDLDDLSTSDEILEAIEHILSKRERPSGVQYLVVGKGYTVDEARWIPLTALNMPGAYEQIQLFEAEEKLVEQCSSGYGISDESSDEEEELAMDFEEDLEDLKDEEDLLERQKARLTDEQIARLLSKQEELGFGSDELMLFDGFEGKLEDDEGITEALQASTILSNVRASGRKKKRPLRGFPSASAFADVLDQDPYNGFDVMDHERPSLRKRPKGRRGALPFELSDSDLEVSIQSAWERDRSKKKMRKQEREELRAQGLLGKKDKLDMKAKYAEGMSLDEIKGEIRDFLITQNET